MLPSKPGFLVATSMAKNNPILQSLSRKGLIERIVDSKEELAEVKQAKVLLLSWPHIVPQSLINRQVECINVHNSLLPKYRGLHAFTWALIHGEHEVGFSVHRVTAKIDAGVVFAQLRIPVPAEEDINSLFARAWVELERWLPTTLASILEQRLKPWEQAETEATFFPRRKPEDGHINWSQTPEQVRNFVRALRPPYTPGAFTFSGSNRLIIDRIEQVNEPTFFSQPGRVFQVLEDTMVVGVERGTVRVWLHSSTTSSLPPKDSFLL